MVRTFPQDLAEIARHWEAGEYDAALDRVAESRKAWPGNAHLQILWASLVQLQEDPRHGLDEAREALEQAIAFEDSSPVGPIELGHFLDQVEADPAGAIEAYARGIGSARRLLIDGLVGRARALLQVDRADEAFRHVLELFHLHGFDDPTPAAHPDVTQSMRDRGLLRDDSAPRAAREVERLLDQLSAHRTA